MASLAQVKVQVMALGSAQVMELVLAVNGLDQESDIICERSIKSLKKQRVSVRTKSVGISVGNVVGLIDGLGVGNRVGALVIGLGVGGFVTPSSTKGGVGFKVIGALDGSEVVGNEVG